MICNDLVMEKCITNKCGHLSDCTKSFDIRKQVKCNENGKSYTLINDLNTQIFNFHLDSKVVSNGTIKRCDFLFYLSEKNTIILIELKGTCFNSALNQIINTIDVFKSNFRQKRVHARIICSGVPNIHNDPKVLKLRKYLKSTGGDYLSKSCSLTENVSNIV